MPIFNTISQQNISSSFGNGDIAIESDES